MVTYFAPAGSGARHRAILYSAAEKLADRYPLIVVRGGEPVGDNGCGPMGPHGFLGREEAVATEIRNWMHGRPYRKQIE